MLPFGALEREPSEFTVGAKRQLAQHRARRGDLVGAVLQARDALTLAGRFGMSSAHWPWWMRVLKLGARD